MATSADAAAILGIYAPYIISTAYTFETEVPSLEAFEQRIINCLETWPWIVCEIDGTVAGYAYAAKHRERAAYQWCVESSVYVHDSFQKKGIAKLLYDSLFEILKLQGFINVYAGITLPNDKSVAFHEKYGFTKFAEYNNIGYKLGKWNTVSWWQLQLSEYPQNPVVPLHLPGVDRSVLEKVLGRYKTGA